MPKRSRQKEAYWRKMLRRQEASRLTAREFCRRHDLSEASFFSWRREIARRDREAASTGNRASNGQSPAQEPGPSSFIPLRLADEASSTVELVHPRGWVLRIPAVFDAEAVRKLLGLLDEPPSEG